MQTCLRFGENRTQRHRGCGREVVPLVGINADPDGQCKKDQQDRKAKLERSPIGERAAHIEVEGHQSQRKHKHDSGKDDHFGRTFLWSRAGFLPSSISRPCRTACSCLRETLWYRSRRLENRSRPEGSGSARDGTVSELHPRHITLGAMCTGVKQDKGGPE